MDVTDAPRTMTVDFAFARDQACGTGPYEMNPLRVSRRSPAIRVEGVPAGARLLRFEMVDLDLLDFDHDGGEVPATPGTATIAEGGLVHWTGPCPPGGSDHRYEMRVEALDAAGKPLATGRSVRTCCRQFERS
ncbi:YbhB/YbcL family Raf kinase inhibitor-like protein [Arenibaculum pallidiluteum]|uniref:hypothetical protein n=1 Tax=Arenibaculum pallidiluteum TaxID=2812559 RepID=UPI001A96D686|nr:hypothetical protein [Arenibaculum pallidiluteum]